MPFCLWDQMDPLVQKVLCLTPWDHWDLAPPNSVQLLVQLWDVLFFLLWTAACSNL